MSVTSENMQKLVEGKPVVDKRPAHGVVFATPDNATGVKQQQSSMFSAGDAQFDSFIKNDDKKKKPGAEEDYDASPDVEYVADRDGVFHAQTKTRTGVYDKLAKDFGFAIPSDATKFMRGADVTIERVDIMPKKLAIARIGKFLHQKFTQDSDKQVALVLILKHLALNSSSIRAPDITQYSVGGYGLDMGEVRRELGDDARKFFRAFADETAEIIRTDARFAIAMAKRYGVNQFDAVYCFDAADCMSNLTRDAKLKIARIKANTLKLSTYDARHVSDMLVEHNDDHGSSSVIE